MTSLIPLILATFFASMFGALAFCKLAPKLGLLDRPDAKRKLQQTPIPVGGGMVVFAVVAVALCALAASGGLESTATLGGKIVAATIISCVCAVVGLIDDRWGLGGGAKCAAELLPIAAIVMITTPPAAIFVSGSTFSLGSFFYLIAFLWLFGCVNSFNLLDGADGFVGTLGAMCLVTLALTAISTGAGDMATVCWLGAAALLGFLVWNAPPARVYLGDSGSLTLGFVVGFFALRVFAVDGVLRPIPALALIALPILDSTCAFARRRNAGRSVFSPDLAHLHHRIQRRFGRGYPTLGALILLQTPLCLGAFFGVYYRLDVIPILAVVVVIGALVATDLFAREELYSTWRRLRASYARRFRRAEYDDEGRLLGSKSVDEWRRFWRVVLKTAQNDECVFLQLNFNLPQAGVDWQGEWLAQRGRNDNKRSLTLEDHVEDDRLVKRKRAKIKFEIPLRLDGDVVGALRAHYDSRIMEFNEAVKRVETLVTLCGDALMNYGVSFSVESPIYFERRALSRTAAQELDGATNDSTKDVQNKL